TFVICGGVGDGLAAPACESNVRLTSVIDEAEKRRYLESADVAINPMFAGSGTNIKMFDFMAAGLPLATTPLGARGILRGADPAFPPATREDFVETLRTLLREERQAAVMGAAGRRLVSEHYSWERISPELGRLLRRQRAALGTSRPAVSVIVPT